MKKRTIPSVILIIICGLITSCGISSGEQIGEAPTTTTLHHTAEPSLDVTVLNPKYDTACWQIKPLQEAKDVTGSFIYVGLDPLNGSGLGSNSLLALSAGSMQTNRIDLDFSPHIFNGILFSPDLKKLADYSSPDAKISIVNQNDVQTYSLPNDDFILSAYLSDGRIRLKNIRDDDNNYEEGKGLALTYYIFDPFTGATQKNTASLPNYYESEPGDRTLQYDLGMKYVLYRSSSYEEEAEFTLFDLVRNKVVWVGPPRDNKLVYLIDSNPDWLPKAYVLNRENLAPAWMPNTEMLTALFLDKSTGQTKYYSIFIDGAVLPMANFDMSDLVNGVWHLAASASEVNLPKWSPNGRYLLTIGNDKEGGNSTYIWDRQENTVYKPCLPNETKTVIPPDFAQYSDGSSFIVKLTFNSFTVPEDRQFQGRAFKSYILDPVKKVIYEIPDLNQMQSPLDTNNQEIRIFSGWVNWQRP